MRTIAQRFSTVNPIFRNNRCKVVKKYCCNGIEPRMSYCELTTSDLHALTKKAVLEGASDIFLGRTVAQKKEWCVKRLTEVLEMFDNYLPVIGIFLDNPIADDIQKKGVEMLIDWGWDKFVETTEPTPPEPMVQDPSS